MDVPVTEEQIRTLAFYLWERDGSGMRSLVSDTHAFDCSCPDVSASVDRPSAAPFRDQ
ncbi:DUF2934 domain-containing protein [Paraburkholderia sp. SIMBA_049]